MPVRVLETVWDRVVSITIKITRTSSTRLMPARCTILDEMARSVRPPRPKAANRSPRPLSGCGKTPEQLVFPVFLAAGRADHGS
jgi:hypothetical protein